MTPGVVLVVPGGVDDETTPSGGNLYDRRMRDGLAAAGFGVREIAVAGAWPKPAEAARAELARSLDALPNGGVVLLDGLVACGVPEVIVPRAARLRLAVLVHMPLADDVGLPGDVAAELDRRERKTLAAAAAVVATSKATARRLAERHGLGTVAVVPPGADRAPLAVGSATGGRLLCVGSVSPLKGQDVLVEAMAGLADLEWYCQCVGPTRDLEFVAGLHERIEQLGLADRNRLLGPRTQEQLRPIYAASDLLVLPSRAESYGMVVTEALARGIPVVGSDVGGVPEALGDTADGVPGLLVPPDDPAALAVALRGWLTDTGLRHRLRAAARLRRETLEPWPVAARLMVEVLRPLAVTEQAAVSAARAAPEWLALREGADAAARAVELLDPLRACLPDGPLVIRDLGCGTGANTRWLAPRLPGPQQWILHDQDAELLALAAGTVSATDGTRVTTHPEHSDLTRLRAADLAGTTLVTASALLDLLSQEEVESLAEACVTAGCSALLTLSVVGRVELLPADPLDAEIGAAFNDHQRRAVPERGRLLGPDAPAVTEAAFRRHGRAVLSRPSRWQLGPGQTALTERWLREWCAAAMEQRPSLAIDVEDYLARRLRACAAGQLRVIVHHVDLLAPCPTPS